MESSLFPAIGRIPSIASTRFLSQFFSRIFGDFLQSTKLPKTSIRVPKPLRRGFGVRTLLFWRRTGINRHPILRSLLTLTGRAGRRRRRRLTRGDLLPIRQALSQSHYSNAVPHFQSNTVGLDRIDRRTQPADFKLLTRLEDLLLIDPCFTNQTIPSPSTKRTARR